MASIIQLRRDTAANWTSANPTLAQGELGLETDTLKIKAGDGSTTWTSLGYLIDTGGYAATGVVNTWTAQQIFTELKETTFTLGTSGSIALDPANGSIQSSTLSGDPTFTDSLEAGQTVILMLVNGASYTVTWPTITWVTSAGNVVPTLTANDTLVFWKVSTTLYGAYVGSYV